MTVKARNSHKSKRKAKGGVMVTLSMAAALALPGAARAQAVTCVQSLAFGEVVPCSAAAGTVLVQPTGAVSSGPGCLSAAGSPLRGRCIVSGSGGFFADIVQVTVSPAAATVVSGGDTMTINNVNIISPGNGPTATISVTLSETVPIGATLNISANQPAGVYSGNFTINTNYQ